MTPKEKAIELYDKIHFALPSYHDEGQQEHKSAKECAIIAVNQILSAIQDLKCENMNWDYWIQVTQEIEKL